MEVEAASTRPPAGEYVQFLWLQNDGSDDPTPPLGDAFLGNEGLYFLDAWLNNGMAPPAEMATASASVTAAFQRSRATPPRRRIRDGSNRL